MHGRIRSDRAVSHAWLFIVAGALFSPLFFLVAIVIGGWAARRGQPSGGLLMATGLVFFLLVQGYGMGKALALRDNARPAEMSAVAR